MFSLKDDSVEYLRFNSSDIPENERGKMFSIGQIVRRIYELKIAHSLINELEDNSIVLLDGTLQTRFDEENKLLEEIYDKAKNKGIVICALAKTTNLLTKKGHSTSALLNLIGPDDSWYYFPVAEIKNDMHKARMFFVKLHRKSKYVFRFESHKETRFNANEIFGYLSFFSNDFEFIGYPYGLVDADRFARISNEEKDILKVEFFSTAGKKGEMFKIIENSINAHDILDKKDFTF